jgi:hypothetical protein
MRDYISIGSAPCEESCVQVNPEGDYHEAMRAECRRFLDLIRKKLGPEPEGARLAVKSNPHDLGTYYEVVCYFEDGDEEAREYALLCEGEAPTTWKDDTLGPAQKAAHEARRAARREELAEEAAECNS